MPEESKATPLGTHGAARLSSVDVDTYNIELKDDGGFIGDRASKGAFRDMLDAARKPLKKLDADPFGDVPSQDIPKKELDAALAGDDPDAAGLVHGVIEEYATELAFVIQRYLKTKLWKDTEHIVIGGGMRESQIGEASIGRAGVMLKAEGIDIDLAPIRNDPDDAGLIGAVHLAPHWVFRGYDSILAVDIGGTNMRAGVIELNLKKADDLSRAAVWHRELWRHADDKPKRDEAIEELADMLQKLIARAEKDGLSLAPFIGIGCPGMIEADGSIDRGAQNLPGNWESRRFNLPSALVESIPIIGESETTVIMHNDAVVQGLSEVPFTRDFEHWGVLTIGTGLGNARFTNRQPLENGDNGKSKKKSKSGKGKK